MIAYHRFIPRETDRDAAHAAKVASPAKVGARSRVPSAKMLLTRANRGDFSSGLAELPQSKTAEIRRFSSFSGFSKFHVGKAAILGAWVDGLERLACMGCPARYPPAVWDRVVADAEQFMDRWATQAVFRRRTRDPLHPSERALLWQLDLKP